MPSTLNWSITVTPEPIPEGDGSLPEPCVGKGYAEFWEPATNVVRLKITVRANDRDSFMCAFRHYISMAFDGLSGLLGMKVKLLTDTHNKPLSAENQLEVPVWMLLNVVERARLTEYGVPEDAPFLPLK